MVKFKLGAIDTLNNLLGKNATFKSTRVWDRFATSNNPCLMEAKPWPMKKTKENSEHYNWGDNCSGWHLVKSERLSVIEELMPPKTQERKHYHNNSQQFFRILSGMATFEIENEVVEIESGSGIHIPPKVKHRIRNDQSENLEFIVISEPTTRGDRYEVPNQ